MKKVLTLLAMAFAVSTAIHAVPAKPGLWQVLTLKDGTQVRAELKGDEYFHFWEAENGRLFVQTGRNVYAESTRADIGEQFRAKRKEWAKMSDLNLQTNPIQKASATTAKAPGYGGDHLVGNKRCLVVLAEFTDKEFQEGHDRAYYLRYCNEEGFDEPNFRGSTRDYFLDQSNGQLTIDFDVVGPVKLTHEAYYYAGDGGTSNVQAFAKEAIQLAADQVDFSQYDWGGNGSVDEVFIVYAGGNRAEGVQNTIWPHKFQLASALTYNGKRVSVYACTSELNGNGNAAGIGTMCHEFSHCMGFPDMYDVDYNCSDEDGREFNGMGRWDLMCSGSYNGNGYCPANYSGYEKWCAGWQYPIELTEDTEVTNMKSISDNGEFYVMYNQGHKDELYYIENRQQTGWDTSLYGNGLLIVHLDYAANVWRNNGPNCKNRSGKDHQCIAPICADGINDDSAGYRYDPFPYGKRDSLTNNSIPPGRLYNANTDGRLYMNQALKNIKRNGDGTMSFTYEAVNKSINNGGGSTEGEVLFSETFDDCNGKGGNDGIFNGTVGGGTFQFDVAGWDNGTKNSTDGCSGAYKCAYFSNVSPRSPEYTVDGSCQLTFRAAPFLNDNKEMTLTLTNSAMSISNNAPEAAPSADGTAPQAANVFTMVKGEMTEFTATITGTGTTRVQFSNGRRFFLDDVVVFVPASTGIKDVSLDPQLTKKPTDGRIYTISGQYVGTQKSLLRKGVYILNGKKIVIR